MAKIMYFWQFSNYHEEKYEGPFDCIDACFDDAEAKNVRMDDVSDLDIMDGIHGFMYDKLCIWTGEEYIPEICPSRLLDIIQEDVYENTESIAGMETSMLYMSSDDMIRFGNIINDALRNWIEVNKQYTKLYSIDTDIDLEKRMLNNYSVGEYEIKPDGKVMR